MRNIDELTTIIRRHLIAQSNINPQLVRDATTEYGAFLDVNSSDSIFSSLLPTDTALLFELKTRESNFNVSMSNDNDTVSFFRAYQLKIILYGDNSDNVANTLIARFRTEKVRNELLSEGIYFERSSEPQRITEFKNNIVWIRNDIDIDIACEVVITSELDPDINAFDSIKIIHNQEAIPENVPTQYLYPMWQKFN